MDILTEEQKTALKLFSMSPLRNKFYWTGGTLLSYHYLRHRTSEDLDFFTDKKFSFEELERLLEEIKVKGGFNKYNSQKIYDRWEIVFENKSPLKIEFVYYNDEKKTLKKRKKVEGIFIDTLEDIAANKTFALVDRDEPKDLFDIYFLIKKKRFTPQKFLDLVNKKFGVRFDKSLFFGEVFKIIPSLSKLKPFILSKNKEKIFEEIEEYFRNASKKHLQSVL